MTRFYFNFLFTQLSHFHSFKTGWLVCRVKFSLLTMLEPWNLLPTDLFPQAVKKIFHHPPVPKLYTHSALDSRWIDYLFYYERTYLGSARKNSFQHSCPHDWFISTHLRSRTSSKVKFKLATTTTNYLLNIPKKLIQKMHYPNLINKAFIPVPRSTFPGYPNQVLVYLLWVCSNCVHFDFFQCWKI
jgi:hypothetical protein